MQDYVETIFEIKRKIDKLESKINEIAERVSRIEGVISTLQNRKNDLYVTIIRYVVFPLIVITGTLVGVKLSVTP